MGYVLKRQCTVVRRMLPFTDLGFVGQWGSLGDLYLPSRYLEIGFYGQS